MKGIDVSNHQGVVDWGKVAKSGVQFAIIRAGYGINISQKDKYFDRNMQGAIAAGIDVGAYWFSYAYTRSQAVQEAKIFLEVMEPYSGKVSFPLYFDWEYDSDKYARRSGVIPTKNLITDMAEGFMSTLKGAGWLAGIYLNQDYWKNKVDMERLSEYEVWLADYTGEPNYPCGVQQTSSTGRVSGISGNVDMNTSFKDYPTLISEGGYNGYQKTETPFLWDTREKTMCIGEVYAALCQSGCAVEISSPRTVAIQKVQPGYMSRSGKVGDLYTLKALLLGKTEITARLNGDTSSFPIKVE